jgi:glycosyltransferase involved in cell wall biosynthesis
MAPFLSIITPTLNAEATLGEALESVASQHEEGVEHLLLDALSDDRTVAIAQGFPGVAIHSEADEGIYDGMNKGAAIASGEWLLFLQADDWLPLGTLAAYREAILKNPSADLLCGGADAVKKEGSVWKTVWSVTDPCSKKLTLENILLGEPMINARLIRREAFWRLGGFSLEYTLGSDRDFLVRAIRANLIQGDVPAPTYRYRWHAGSSTMNEGNSLSSRLTCENISIARKHLDDAVGSDREVLGRWHESQTLLAAMNDLERGRWCSLARSIMEGTKVNPGWSLTFAGRILRALPGFLGRGCRTRSQVLADGQA